MLTRLAQMKTPSFERWGFTTQVSRRQLGSRGGGLFRLCAVSFAALGLIEAQCPAGEASLSSQAPAPTDVSGKAELDAMKTEFATLMKRRAGLEQQCRESRLRIDAAGSMVARNPLSSTETGKQVRKAVSKLDAALDQHPQMKALQEEYEAVQTQKVAVAKQQAEVMAGWRKAHSERLARLKAAVEQVEKKSAESLAELLKRAGVKDTAELSESDKAGVAAIESGRKKDLEAARKAFGNFEALEKEEHEKDGSMARFEELAKRHDAMEVRQAELRQQQADLRVTLRKTDPALVASQQVVAEASSVHASAVEASPVVVAARRFIANAEKMRAEIDARARVLRQAIIEKDSEFRPVLDSQARAAGLDAG